MIYFLRHDESEANRDIVFSGQRACGLTRLERGCTKRKQGL